VVDVSNPQGPFCSPRFGFAPPIGPSRMLTHLSRESERVREKVREMQDAHALGMALGRGDEEGRGPPDGA
jgi:hypothetical protein